MKNIRVIVKSGKYPGKKIVVLAGVHGNEVCGLKAFDELIPKLNIEKGKVTFIYANLEAQRQNKRFVEYNLNRCFLNEQPSDIVNSLEGKTAKKIMKYLDNADILLDLHSSNSSGNKPFLICENDCLDLIDCLSPDRVIMGIDKAEKGGTDGYMFNQGKPGICVECGLHESEESIKVAKESILNFLTKVGCLNGDYNRFYNKKLYFVNYIYKSKNEFFNLKRDFKDFEEVNEKILVGFDGNDKVYAEKGDVIIFPHSVKGKGKECFLVLRSYPWSK